MRSKKWLPALAAAVWASVPALGAELTLQPQTLVDGAESDRRPLMHLLDQVNLAEPLERHNISIFGYVQGSYTWNFDKPAGGENVGRVFDFEHDEPNLNQWNLTIERPVEISPDTFDIGGRIEWIWGADAGLIHSNGLFDWYDGPRDPENQLDLNQAYIDVALPIGNGLGVRAGKMVTLLGWETIDPTPNPFYSHSYLFGFAIPFTHTGVMITYPLDENWVVEAGVFRGWEQSLEDNNDAESFHFKVGYTSTDEKLGVIGQFVTGPEQDDDQGSFRTVFDFLLSYALSDRCSVGLNIDYGFEEDAAAGGNDAEWYGIAGYASYVLNDRFTLNGRAEWFRDDDGTRVLEIDAHYFEVTAGVTITPFPGDAIARNLILRPEIRVDFSDEDVFDGGNDDTQVTAAIDVIFKY